MKSFSITFKIRAVTEFLVSLVSTLVSITNQAFKHNVSNDNRGVNAFYRSSVFDTMPICKFIISQTAPAERL